MRDLAEYLYQGAPVRISSVPYAPWRLRVFTFLDATSCTLTAEVKPKLWLVIGSSRHLPSPARLLYRTLQPLGPVRTELQSPKFSHLLPPNSYHRGPLF